MPPNALSPAAALVILAMGLGLLSAIAGAWAWAILCRVEGRPLLPREPGRPVPWGPIAAFPLLLFQVVLVPTLLLAFQDRNLLGAAGKPPDPKALRDFLLLDALAKIQVAILIPPLLKLVSGAKARDLGLARRGLAKNAIRGVWLCFLILPLVYLVSIATLLVSERPESGIHPIQVVIAGAKGPWTAPIVLFAAVIAAPIAEEMLFRGVIFGWLRKVGMKRPNPFAIGDGFDPDVSDVDPFAAAIRSEPLASEIAPTDPDPFRHRSRQDWTANVAASLLFAGLHYAQWPAPVPLFVLSLALGEVYRRTGSLVAPIALHAAFNSLSTVALLVVSALGVKLPV